MLANGGWDLIRVKRIKEHKNLTPLERPATHLFTVPIPLLWLRSVLIRYAYP